MFEEPLKLLSVERWVKLKCLFESDWPRGISGYTTLDVAEHIINNGNDYGFKVYCPYDDLSNGFVGLNIKGPSYEVIIQCPKSDTTALENALRHTKIIDWNQSILISFAPRNIMEIVHRIAHDKNSTLHKQEMTDVFYIDDNRPLFDVSTPPGISLQLLDIKYAKLVDDTWPFQYPGSLACFQMLIKAKLGFGLFENNNLVAWCFVKETGALGHLYTLEEHRRKGFGEMVLKLISNALRKDNKKVLAFCIVENDNARKLYQKLDFCVDEAVTWSIWVPNVRDNAE